MGIWLNMVGGAIGEKPVTGTNPKGEPGAGVEFGATGPEGVTAAVGAVVGAAIEEAVVAVAGAEEGSAFF